MQRCAAEQNAPLTAMAKATSVTTALTLFRWMPLRCCELSVGKKTATHALPPAPGLTVQTLRGQMNLVSPREETLQQS